MRGIKIIYDNIPLTFADGQSQTDSIDLSSAESVEIIKGPASALYGNASGGVISVYSEKGTKFPFFSMKPLLGSYGLIKLSAKSAGNIDNLSYLINFNRLNYDGFREHSKTENFHINSNFNHLLSDNSELTLILNYIETPTAEDPGALTENQLEEDRLQAAAGNLISDSGESLKQLRAGITLNNIINENNEIQLKSYIITRDFEQRLPFGIVFLTGASWAED